MNLYLLSFACFLAVAYAGGGVEVPSCDDRWTLNPEEDACWKLVRKERRKFDDALLRCKEDEAKLATGFISSKHIRKVLRRLNFRGHFWTGYRYKDGAFKDANDDSQVDLTNYPFKRGYTAQPTNGKDCITVKRGHMFHKKCNKRKFYICEKEPTITVLP